MDPVEFAIEKTGANPVQPEQRYYARGLIYDPNAVNTEEEIADLDRIYSEVDRQSLPASWDSRAKGMFICFEILGWNHLKMKLTNEFPFYLK